MDLAELEHLIGMVKHSQVGELTLKQGDARLTLRKVPAHYGGQSTALVTTHGNALQLTGGDEDYEDDETFDVEPPNLKIVEAASESLVAAPLVGVFRHVKPVVGLGAKVKAGQKIGLIEAMKLINDVVAPNDGVVSDVLIEDGLPVEYGQTLFVLNAENER